MASATDDAATRTTNSSMTMLLHTIIALTLQLICALLTSNWWIGAAIGSAFYIGRELAQAEYRIIYTHYGRKRANAPWWCGFDRRAWTVKGMLDWIVPAVALVFVACVLH